MAPSVGRKFADARQRLKGRQPLTFQLEVVPYFAEGIPSHIQSACFVWQRGTKLQFTSMAEKSQSDGVVRWDKALMQTSTIYRDGNGFAPKQYSFKLQGIKGAAPNEQPVTFAKNEINLAAYCSCETSGTRELIVELRPSGQLHVGVTAVWMKNSKPDQDSMTDLSHLSIDPSMPSSSYVEDQDLSGFDDHMVQKAGQASPKRVAFEHSHSMPTPQRGPGQDKKRRLKPSLTISAIHASPEPKTPAQMKQEADGAPNFAGFQTVPLDNDMVTPTIPVKSISFETKLEPRNGIHRKTKSMPASSEAISTIPESESSSFPNTPTSPQNLAEMMDTLRSSDDESENTSGGPLASVRRWWTGKKPPRAGPGLQSPFAVQDTSEAELEAIDREMEPQALKELCRSFLRQRDDARLAESQQRRRVMWLERDVEALESAKKGMAERLAVSEDRLMRLTRDDLMASLVQAKLLLAQTDYTNLSLQGELNQERLRNRSLRSQLTHMENEYHIALNRISAERPGFAPLECASSGSDDEAAVSMPCLPFSSAAWGTPSTSAKQVDMKLARPLKAGTLTKPSLPETCSAVGAGEHSSVRISASAAQFCATAVSASDGVQLPVTVATSAG